VKRLLIALLLLPTLALAGGMPQPTPCKDYEHRETPCPKAQCPTCTACGSCPTCAKPVVCAEPEPCEPEVQEVIVERYTERWHAPLGFWYVPVTMFRLSGANTDLTWLENVDPQIHTSTAATWGHGIGLGYTFASGWAVEGSFLRLREETSARFTIPPVYLDGGLAVEPRRRTRSGVMVQVQIPLGGGR
jgi:hypothetical protein